MQITRKYGWRHSLPDARDYVHTPHAPSIPPRIDPLTAKIPAYDQGQLGSCTGNGCARVDQYAHFKAGFNIPNPSRLFIYYFARLAEGTVKVDAGATVRDAFNVLIKQGAPDEKVWPYKINKFTTKPSTKAMNQAKKRTVYEYARINIDVDSFKIALAEGYPIVFGFRVPENFESQECARTGYLNMPQKGEKWMGGHCVVIDGFDDTSRNGDFWVANSWGSAWGISGWFKMPYDFLRPNCSDAWIARKAL